jgi:hypothetical protein
MESKGGEGFKVERIAVAAPAGLRATRGRQKAVAAAKLTVRNTGRRRFGAAAMTPPDHCRQSLSLLQRHLQPRHVHGRYPCQLTLRNYDLNQN